MLYFVPFAAYLITSPLAPAAFLAELEGSVEPVQTWRFSGTHDCDFEGEISVDGFTVQRLRWLSGKAVARSVGRVEAVPDGGSLIHVETQVPLASYLKALILPIAFALGQRRHLADAGERPVALLLLAGVVLLLAVGGMVAFNLDVSRTARRLKAIGHPSPSA
jgi:hypothetical protein